MTNERKEDHATAEQLRATADRPEDKSAALDEDSGSSVPDLMREADDLEERRRAGPFGGLPIDKPDAGKTQGRPAFELMEIRERKLWARANQMLTQHGAEAAALAQGRAADLTSSGDLAGGASWLELADRIVQLRTKG